MSQFKSFKPRKFASLKANGCKRNPKNIFYGERMDELCSICGYPNGEHYSNNNCPTEHPDLISENLIPDKDAEDFKRKEG